MCSTKNAQKMLPGRETKTCRIASYYIQIRWFCQYVDQYLKLLNAFIASQNTSVLALGKLRRQPIIHQPIGGCVTFRCNSSCSTKIIGTVSASQTSWPEIRAFSNKHRTVWPRKEVPPVTVQNRSFSPDFRYKMAHLLEAELFGEKW